MQGELREEFINLIKIYYAVITRIGKELLHLNNDFK